jgi:hypothetical protein
LEVKEDVDEVADVEAMAGLESLEKEVNEVKALAEETEAFEV